MYFSYLIQFITLSIQRSKSNFKTHFGLKLRKIVDKMLLGCSSSVLDRKPSVLVIVSINHRPGGSIRVGVKEHSAVRPPIVTNQSPACCCTKSVF